MKFYLISGLLLLAGCATVSRNYTWQGVQRVVQPQKEIESLGGNLIVYTETVPADIFSEDSLHEYHLPYRISDESGKSIRRIKNHSSPYDPDPETVTLDPGKYVIVAESRTVRREIIGAVIERGKSTVIHSDES